MKLSDKHRGLYRAIAGLGSGIAPDRLTGHERRLAATLTKGGYLREGDGVIRAVPPFELARGAGPALAGEAYPVDLSERDADWRAPVTAKGDRPVLCVSVPDEAHGRLRALGPDRVRSLLAEAARLGLDDSLSVLAYVEVTSPLGKSARKVYGIAVDPDVASVLRGKGKTQHTAAFLISALEVGFDAAMDALKNPTSDHYNTGSIHMGRRNPRVRKNQTGEVES